MARIYLFMVASIQKWNLIHNLSEKTDIIERGDNLLYLLPWMELTSETSSTEERREWIIEKILNVIDKEKLNGKNITVLIHANDYWANGSGILEEQDQLPNSISKIVRRCILYRRDATNVYKYLTDRRNIQMDSYLTNIEEHIYE